MKISEAVRSGEVIFQTKLKEKKVAKLLLICKSLMLRIPVPSILLCFIATGRKKNSKITYVDKNTA